MEKDGTKTAISLLAVITWGGEKGKKGKTLVSRLFGVPMRGQKTKKRRERGPGFAFVA